MGSREPPPFAYALPIVETLAKVPAERRTDAFISGCIRLYEGTKPACEKRYNTADMCAIIAAFSQFPPAMHTDLHFIQDCIRIGKHANHRKNLNCIVTALGEIPPEVRSKAFLQNCDRLCEGVNDGADIAAIITTLRTLPAGYAPDRFIRDYKTLACNNTDILKALARKHPSEAWIRDAAYLGNCSHMDSHRSNIIKSLFDQEINDVQLATIRERFDQEDEVAKSDPLVGHLILRLVEEDRNIERRAARNRRQRVPAPVEYAAGLNVHTKKRDTDTLAALHLLKRVQGDRHLDYQALITNMLRQLETIVTDPKKKAKILYALDKKTLPENVKESIWGPLVTDKNVIGGENGLSGKECLARIWLFIENIKDPNEKGTARTGFFNALCDYEGTEAEGRLVCEPGRIQRLVVGVLQGRLAGVNIERIKSVHSIVTAFFEGKYDVNGNVYPQFTQPQLLIDAQACVEANKNELSQKETETLTQLLTDTINDLFSPENSM